MLPRISAPDDLLSFVEIFRRISASSPWGTEAALTRSSMLQDAVELHAPETGLVVGTEKVRDRLHQAGRSVRNDTDLHVAPA
jgi:hypothetical protein